MTSAQNIMWSISFECNAMYIIWSFNKPCFKPNHWKNMKLIHYNSSKNLDFFFEFSKRWVQYLNNFRIVHMRVLDKYRNITLICTMSTVLCIRSRSVWCFVSDIKKWKEHRKSTIRKNHFFWMTIKLNVDLFGFKTDKIKKTINYFWVWLWIWS